MAFDEARYEQEVIKPLRSHRGPLRDTDLARRYAIEPGMTTEAQLREHLRRVRAYWNQNSSGASNKAAVCRLLLAADEKLEKQPGVSLVDPAWWQRQAQQQAQVRQAEIGKLAANLTSGYGRAGRITKDQLDQIRALFPDLMAADVDQAVRTAGLTVLDAVDLPTSSGLDGVQYTKLKDSLAEVGVPTIVQLLHPDLTVPFSLVRGFSVSGQPGLTLDGALVGRRRAEADTLADSTTLRARKNALGVLATGLQAGADLRTIALYQVVERVRGVRANVSLLQLHVDAAVKMGLAPDDAELLVLSLPAGGDTQVSVAAHIAELMDDGQLRAAQQALGGLPADDPAAAEIKARVDQASAAVERCVREAAQALSAGREDDARRLLLQAYNLARDDDDVELRLRALPVGPPREFTAKADGAEVRLSWTAPGSGGDSLHYRVVRGDAPTSSPDDGIVVTESSGLSAVDKRPGVARAQHYAVFACSDGRVWSRPARAELVVAPPVIDAALRADAVRITGVWKAHEAVVAVTVRRGERRAPASAADGAAIAATRTSFVDKQVREGTEYFYRIEAVYRDPLGREVSSAPVVLSAIPRSAASAVVDLTAVTVSVANDVARVRLSWPATPDEVRIRYSNRAPSWPKGTLIPAAEAQRFGTEVSGGASRSGGRVELETDVPAGYHAFVPFAYGGTGVVVGHTVWHGVVEGVQQLTARRTGRQTTLSWEWPPDVSLAEVEWVTSSGEVHTRRITRGEFMNSAGFVVTAGGGTGTATVRAIAVGTRGETASPPAVVEVAAQDLRLGYRISRPPRLKLHRRQPWQLTITVDNDCAGVSLSLVVARGLVVPLRPDQGTIVQQFTDLRLAAGVPLTFDFELPAGVRKPYWIKCFVTRPASVQVTHPPIDEMKVA